MKITKINSVTPGVSFWKVTSDRTENLYYIVTVDKRKGERYTCQCPNWTFEGQFKDGRCKHIIRVLELELRNKERAS